MKRGALLCLSLFAPALSGCREEPAAPASSSHESFSPKWSPDGERIAFSSNRSGTWDIYTMKPDGSDVRQLTLESGGDSPEWSPDGASIYFDAPHDERRALFRVSSAGGPHELFYDAEGHLVFALELDAGGRLGVVGRYPPPRRDNDFLGDVLLLSREAELIRVLTEHPANDDWPDIGCGGSLVAFGSNRAVYAGDMTGEYRVYLVSLESGEIRMLVDFYAAAPAFSPDCTRVAFHHKDLSEEGGESYDIYTVAIDGSDLVQVTSGPAWETLPDWSPDGGELVFRSNAPGTWQIFRASVDGTGLTQLTGND